MTDPHDAVVAAYRRRRNQIASKYRLTYLNRLNTDAWRTAKKMVSTSIRDDSDGLLLLERFERTAKNYRGGCFADDGESIGLWDKPASEVRAAIKAKAEQIRAKIGSRALFHPGYLPLGKHKGWPALRVQNPNPSPYNLDVEWCWIIDIKPGLDTEALHQIEFFVGEKRQGSRIGVDACVKLVAGDCDPDAYVLEQPYVTTQARLDRLIADANLYGERLRTVRARFKRVVKPEGCNSYSYVSGPLAKLWKQL